METDQSAQNSLRSWCVFLAVAETIVLWRLYAFGQKPSEDGLLGEFLILVLAALGPLAVHVLVVLPATVLRRLERGYRFVIKGVLWCLLPLVPLLLYLALQLTEA